jgi:hypothetical protein
MRAALAAEEGRPARIAQKQAKGRAAAVGTAHALRRGMIDKERVAASISILHPRSDAALDEAERAQLLSALRL